MTTPQLITDGSLVGEMPAIPEFEPPPADLFARRAERLVRLANSHAMSGYLHFAGALCQAQQKVLDAVAPRATGPDSAHQSAPSLPIDAGQALGQDAFHQRLMSVLDALPADALPAPARATRQVLRNLPPVQLRAACEALLAGQYHRLEPGWMPFIAAGMQVHWSALARAGTGGAPACAHQDPSCPACGSAPVGSVVRIGGAHQGLRYLACSLCGSQWHYTRVKCGSCESTKGINYLSIEGGSGAVKAETCDECGGYVKIFYMERDAELEVGADDLATLALDILVDEAGFQRTGPNLLLQPG